MMTYAPVVLFVYNRPWHTSQTIESLLKNEEAAHTKLIIYADASKAPNHNQAVKLTQEYIAQVQGFAAIEIVYRQVNFGLYQSVIEGVTETLTKYEQVIVLEDDLVVSPFFLRYMNQALAMYKDEEEVASIHGYNYPVQAHKESTFFLRGADCWGWATWSRAWKLLDTNAEYLLKTLQDKNLTKTFNFNNTYPYSIMLRNKLHNKNNSWAILWYASAFLKNKYTLYPSISMVKNIGNDNSGTHARATDEMDVTLSTRPLHLQKIEISQNKAQYNAFAQYFSKLKLSIKDRWLMKLGW